MKRIRRTEVTVEMDEIVLITNSQTTSLLFCPHCHTAVAMITPEQAAEIVAANTSAIYRWIEEGRIHGDTAKGRLLVCPKSLCEAIRETRTRTPSALRP